MSLSNNDSAERLLRDLRDRDVRLWREADRLCYRAPSGILTPALLDRIRSMKPDLLALLKHHTHSTSAANPCPPNIVLLHAGPGKRRIFCVHAVDGGVAPFLPLSRELSPEATTYGLSVVDLVDRTPIPGSIRGIAGHYAEQVLQVQEHDPYVLAGWSSGSWIAFEIACELSRRGCHVGGLIVIDIGAPPRGYDMQLPKGGEQLGLTPLQDQSARLWWRFLTLYNTHEVVVPSFFWRLDDQEKSAYLVEHRDDPAIFSRNCDLLAVRDADDMRFRFAMVNLQHDAIIRYEPSSYGGPIQLFVACPDSFTPESRKYRFDGIANFWKTRTTGAIHAELVCGDHSAPLSQPAVSRVAQSALAMSRADYQG